MAVAHPVETQKIRDLYLNDRWPPLVIARHLGCSVQVVHYRLHKTRATHDPRAATPFCKPVAFMMPEEGYSVGPLLKGWIVRDGRSMHQVSRAAGLTASGLSRVVKQERGIGPDNCGHLADTLQLSVAERDRLYVAAGHAPPTLTALGGWTEALANYCRTLLLGEG